MSLDSNIENDSEFRHIDLNALVLSETRCQKERRAHFKEADAAELLESVRAKGVIQPILVRPLAPRGETDTLERYEVVAGERRVIAAEEALRMTIPAMVRDLSDEEALQLQLIENLQREDLTELAEAEGYEDLLKMGKSADEIAVMVGKSRRTIYTRMQLLTLSAAARKAFYDGTLSSSVALLIARIPVAALRDEMLKEVTAKQPEYRGGGVMSYREAQQLLSNKYLLRLKEAPFPTGDPTILVSAGPCGTCPKRTGNQPELFEDIGSADICTDPVCFNQKKVNWGKMQLEAAREEGRKVITGAEAKRIAPHGASYISGGYAKLEDTCQADPKRRTFKQLLGRGAKTALLQTPKGDVVAVVDVASTVKQLQKEGTIKPERKLPTQRPGESAKERETKEIEKEFRRRVYLALHAKAPTKVTRPMLEQLIDHEMDYGVIPDAVCDIWDKPGSSGLDLKQVLKLPDAKLTQLLFELLLGDWLDSTYSDFNGMGLDGTKIAASLKIDVKKIRAQVIADRKAPVKPVPAGKGSVIVKARKKK
ncbi:MAG TPA: ParB/RepB/Spo0J family partition protein [Steroidobacteraceae bacterium]|jgi:ParB/RepB/Spo0J family partition protein